MNCSTFQSTVAGKPLTTRCCSNTTVSGWMEPSNLEHVRTNQSSLGGGLPESTTVGTYANGSSNGSGPSVTLRSLDGRLCESGVDGPVAVSNLAPLKAIRSLKIGGGIWNDICSRIPYYASDWIDAWNYRVVPATTLIFFAKYGNYSTERPPDLPDLFQCSSGDRLLFGSHRDYWKVRRCGGLAFLCNGCWGILSFRWPTIVHSRCYRRVFRR